MHENLTSKTARGIKWSSVSTVTNAVVQLGYSAVMARMLEPAAFGLMAMSGVVLGFGSYFAQMGMSQAIIHKATLSKEDVRVAFTSSFILGFLFFSLAWISAPLSRYIFDNPELVPILRVTCISLVITGLNSTATSLLRRQLEFKSLAIIQIVSYLIGYVVIGVSLAYLGFGVWSLVYASIGQSVLVTVISYFFARHSLRLLFDWQYYKPLFSFGSKISLINFMDFLGSDLDALLIGRFLGETSLGLYNRAFILIRQPVGLLVGTVSRVLFPAFSRIQTELTRLKNAYLFSVSSIVIIVWPICCGISIASEQIVYLMLGNQWATAVPILQILALTTPFRVLMHFSGVVCDATGTLKWKAILHFLYFVLLGLFFFMLMDFGIIGFAYAVLLAAICKNIGYYLITRTLLHLTVGELLKAYKPGMFSAIITSIFIYATALLLESLDSPQLVTLGAEIGVGVLSWLLSLYLSPDKTLLRQITGKMDNAFASKTRHSPFSQWLTRATKALTN